jgi:hypothetical protein
LLRALEEVPHEGLGQIANVDFFQVHQWLVVETFQ